MRKKVRPAQAEQSAPLIVRAAPRMAQRAILQVGPLRLPAAIGRSGRTIAKREGDGATPIGSMKILYGFHRGKNNPPTTPLPMHRIQRHMSWCDAPEHPSYNRLVRLPITASHEDMWRSDHLYDICLVLDWNLTSRSRYKGSAIFMHMARSSFEPTAGCVALQPQDMRRLLPHLRRNSRLIVL